MRLQHILVPVDFSRSSLHALDHAIALSKPFGATLTLLTVVEPLYYSAGFDLSLAEQEREARDVLAKLERRLQRRGLNVRTCVRVGRPYQVIAHEARGRKADVIVMGTHGHTGVARMLIGSVAERVVRIAGCPVLTVRNRRRSNARRKAPK